MHYQDLLFDLDETLFDFKACEQRALHVILDVYKRQAVEPLYMWNRVLFVERSGELQLLARLRTESLEPKGNQV